MLGTVVLVGRVGELREHLGSREAMEVALAVQELVDELRLAGHVGGGTHLDVAVVHGAEGPARRGMEQAAEVDHLVGVNLPALDEDTELVVAGLAAGHEADGISHVLPDVVVDDARCAPCASP